MDSEFPIRVDNLQLPLARRFVQEIALALDLRILNCDVVIFGTFNPLVTFAFPSMWIYCYH